jgi:hypothetical protein
MSPTSGNLASAPADPSVVSFLDLPTEVRNAIYVELYEHADPIIVTACQAKIPYIKTAQRRGGRIYNTLVPHPDHQSMILIRCGQSYNCGTDEQ